MVLSIHSFSYRRSVPSGIDMVFDCRFLKNPYWVPKLRGLTGQNAEVAEYLSKDVNWSSFLQKTLDLIMFLLPQYRDAGIAYFQLGFGCSGGQHRSVFVAETIASEVRKFGWELSVDHRELLPR